MSQDSQSARTMAEQKLREIARLQAEVPVQIANLRTDLAAQLKALAPKALGPVFEERSKMLDEIVTGHVHRFKRTYIGDASSYGLGRAETVQAFRALQDAWSGLVEISLPSEDPSENYADNMVVALFSLIVPEHRP